MDWWRAAGEGETLGAVPAVLDLTHDSREVRSGYAFAAIPGARHDGHDYLEAAVAAGAAACVVQRDHHEQWSAFAGRVPLVIVEDVRQSLGLLASAVHGIPSEQLRVIGVTGTDGKTTCAHLISHVLDACGFDCGYLSGVAFDYGSGSELNATHMTTVEATSIQAMLSRALEAGRRSMVLEASSEGLAQGRLNGCAIDVAVFTNLSRDHLDFHGTMERYLEAKSLLFRKLDEPTSKQFPRASILNADEPSSEYLRGVSKAPVLTYAVKTEADFVAGDVVAEGFSLRFALLTGKQSIHVEVPLIGRFNAYNSLAAIAAASSQGASPVNAASALATFPGIPGRMERIEAGQAFSVLVDIASTPAALENVLTALRPATTGRLWVVFGAAGGRDPARRDGMGLVAGRLADRCVLTNEDPRDEDPDAIIEAIAAGLRECSRKEGVDFVRVPDRREAIRYAFEHASHGDTVLLAGKATEPSMVFKDGARPWDERAVARELLS